MLHQHNACFNTQQTTAAHCNTQEMPSKWDQIKAAEAAAHEVENHVYDLFKFSHLIVKLKAVFMEYARKKSVVLEPGGTSQNEAQVLFKPEFTTAIRLIADENKCPLDDTQAGKLWMVLDHLNGSFFYFVNEFTNSVSIGICHFFPPGDLLARQLLELLLRPPHFILLLLKRKDVVHFKFLINK